MLQVGGVKHPLMNTVWLISASATHCRSEELVSPKTVLSYRMRDTGQHKGRDQNPLRYNIRSWDPFNLEIHLGTFCVLCCRISWYMNYLNKLLNNLPIIIFVWINITFVGLMVLCISTEGLTWTRLAVLHYCSVFYSIMDRPTEDVLYV